jgi:hypothetical protein
MHTLFSYMALIFISKQDKKKKTLFLEFNALFIFITLSLYKNIDLSIWESLNPPKKKCFVGIRILTSSYHLSFLRRMDLIEWTLYLAYYLTIKNPYS